MNLDEALNPDLIGALPDGKMTLPKPAFEAVHAAARRFLALTETGPDYEEVRQKIKWLVECAVHGDNIDAVVSEILVAVDAAPADYLTEEDR